MHYRVIQTKLLQEPVLAQCGVGGSLCTGLARKSEYSSQQTKVDTWTALHSKKTQKRTVDRTWDCDSGPFDFVHTRMHTDDVPHRAKGHLGFITIQNSIQRDVKGGG